jgi:hypothetical protein
VNLNAFQQIRREVGMRKLVIIFATLVAGSLILVVGSSAQRRGMPGERMYNPQTVETISGVVVSVGKFGGMKGMSQGVHAVVKTDTETIAIHLGPAWFIDNQETKISPNDRVEVKGSRITFEGKPAIIAAEVTKDRQTLTLRDANGLPIWRGWRRK